mmetsp:Transcript_16609/g.49570  ORF Transcript_16609/g.49570 Transcript_16609/m.49570 type:complete len:240 (-) Transcript_16609:38-757(-)
MHDCNMKPGARLDEQQMTAPLCNGRNATNRVRGSSTPKRDGTDAWRALRLQHHSAAGGTGKTTLPPPLPAARKRGNDQQHGRARNQPTREAATQRRRGIPARRRPRPIARRASREGRQCRPPPRRATPARRGDGLDPQRGEHHHGAGNVHPHHGEQHQREGGKRQQRQVKQRTACTREPKKMKRTEECTTRAQDLEEDMEGRSSGAWRAVTQRRRRPQPLHPRGRRSRNLCSRERAVGG